ncbi:MAG: DUF2971 domain-containing protein [Rhodanobacter sp.]
MSTEQEVAQLFNSLWNDIKQENEFPEKKPKLAHYTNVVSFEGIFVKNEFWLSNPMLMNDHEELRFGMLEGHQMLLNSPLVSQACITSERYREFIGYYERAFEEHANGLALDTYVGCFSLHDSDLDKDGRLSMWRGYGASGEGVAIVMDTSRIKSVQDSPMILSEVKYGTAEERREWIRVMISKFAEVMAINKFEGEALRGAAHAFLQRLRYFALFTKHTGFADEREWRMVYFKERDTKGIYTDRLSYHIGTFGVEPKLKMSGVVEAGISSIDVLVESIITGPAVSSPIAVASLKRMLESIGKHELSKLVHPSGTPLRIRR